MARSGVVAWLQQHSLRAHGRSTNDDESFLRVRESFLRVRESFLRVRESFLRVRESFLRVRESFC